jgi:hypothetical protein
VPHFVPNSLRQPNFRALSLEETLELLQRLERVCRTAMTLFQSLSQPEEHFVLQLSDRVEGTWKAFALSMTASSSLKNVPVNSEKSVFTFTGGKFIWEKRPGQLKTPF